MNAGLKHKWPIVILWVVLVCSAWSQASAASKVKWVTVEGTAPLTVSDKSSKARSAAIAAAERYAVAEALAKGISLESLLVNLRLSGGIMEAIPFGKIVSKEILEEGPVKAASGETMFYHVRLKAGVTREHGGKDPTFGIDATLNKSVFKEGDDLEIRIRSTRNCFIAIYNILEDKKIIRLYPNYLSNKNALKANVDLVYPGLKDSQKGLKLIMHLPENKKAVTESIYILASTRPFKFEDIDVQEGIYGVYNGQTAFMKDLIREIVGIPLGERAEFLMPYDIRKK